MKPQGVNEAGETSKESSSSLSSVSRGIAILELVLRIIAMFGTLGSSLAMGTTNETLPFSTQTVLFQAQYSDIPTFSFFVISNAVVCGYLAVSLPVAIYHVMRTKAAKTRSLLIFLDVIMLALLTSGASSSAAIVYLAHKGNTSANWFSICRQYQSFCDRITGSLIGSFGAVFIFIILIPLSGLLLSRRRC